MNFGIDENTTHKINGVFSKYPQVESVVIYGSRVKGNFRLGSDIDFTLKGENIDFHILAKISNDLDDLLTPYKFDISIFKDIENQDLIEHINRAGKIFYKRKNAD